MMRQTDSSNSLYGSTRQQTVIPVYMYDDPLSQSDRMYENKGLPEKPQSGLGGWKSSGSRKDDFADLEECEVESEYTHYEQEAALKELEEVKIHPITNVFVGARKLEKRYHRIRLKENAPMLRYVSGLLALCFTLDCITLVYRWNASIHVVLYIVLCSIVCFQLGLFIFRNRIYSHLLIHYYHYTTTALGASAFAYVVLSDSLNGCIIFSSSAHWCDPSGPDRNILVVQTDDSTRVAYGMSLLFGVLPFGFRISFAYCAVMYVIAIGVHILLRVLTMLSLANSGLGFVILDSLLLDTLFLVTIMATMLYGAYVYERNDRIMFLRMRKSQLESDLLQMELQSVREELGWAEDEANTNELKLEIERAKSDLDRLYPGAQLELESWVMPIETIVVDKRVGEGSCGEVYRGRIRFPGGFDASSMKSMQHRSQQPLGGNGGFDKLGFNGGGFTPSNRNHNQQPAFSFRSAYRSPLQSPHNPAGLGENYKFDTNISNGCATPTHTHRRQHRREYSTIPFNSVVAVKRIPKHKITRKTVLHLLQETLVMSKCRHPNVLKLIGLIYDPFVCVVFEYMALGSLKDLLEDSRPNKTPPKTLVKAHLSKLHKYDQTKEVFDEEEQRIQRNNLIQSMVDFTEPKKHVWTHIKSRMCVNVAAGVSYLHSKNIIHRDLKSSNLMVDSTHAVKVADMGTARQLTVEGTSFDEKDMHGGTGGGRPARPLSRVGSPLWIAPEVISSEGKYNDKCDVWSFGVILCEMMTHRDPYTDENGRCNFNLLKVIDGTLSPLDYVKDVVLHTPPGIVKLALDCCRFDPKERCTMKEALFRLLQIAVEQETTKVEAEAIAAAGPYLRYGLPSRRNIFKRHSSSTVNLLEDNSNNFLYQDSSYSTTAPQSQRSTESKVFDNEDHHDDDDVDTESDLSTTSEEEVEDDDEDFADMRSHDEEYDYDNIDEEEESKSSGYGTSTSHVRTSRRPLSTETMGTFATAMESLSEQSHYDMMMMETDHKPKPVLRQSYSTHTLGETVDTEIAQSILSTYPSMGSIVNHLSRAS